MPKTSGKDKSKQKVRAEIAPGTIRVTTSDLCPYEKTKKSWKKSDVMLAEAALVIQLFKAHDNLKALIDAKDPRFLKGQVSPDGKTQGARINILPNGKKLDKAYSLFAQHLTIHRESSRQHWDVIYQNPGGTYSYLYTIDKKMRNIKEKYKAVEEFAKVYPKLQRNVYNALKREDDHLAVPMYTLLKTYMRIGNEIYYKMHGHKGLTTLMKKDISLNGNSVFFNYISKDGVPVITNSTFPEIYIRRLKKMLDSIAQKAFVFVNQTTGHPLTDIHFKEAFRRYCGKEFYPHIVRSYYATTAVKNFLNTHKLITKEDARDLFLSIAEKLGHRKFDKKNGVWKESYNVTIHHYIQPELVEEVRSVISK